MSFKKQIFALFVFTILGLGLFGQNCSQSEFLADEKAQKNQNSSITPLEAKASNRVVVDHRTLQLLKNEELKLFIENAKESGGEVRQVLPNGDMELIYATVEEAQAAVKQNLDLNSSHEKINSEKQIILKSIPDYVSQQTAIKKFDLNKVKLMPLENIKQSDLQSDQPVQIVKPNKVSEFRDQVTKILNDFPILNKISNSTSQLNSKSILNTNQSIVGFDNSDSPFFPPIGDQLRLGSCVAWSVGYYLNSYTQAKTENMDINSSEGKRFLCSPSYLYPFTNGGFDLGTYPLQVLQTIQDFGCASLAESPYKTMMRYDGEYEKDYFPSLDFQKKALKYRIKKFDSIALNPVDKEGLKNIKQAIKNGSLLTIAIRAYDEFIYYNGTPLIKNVYCVKTFKERDLSYPQSVMTKIDKSCPSSGGHAVTIVGYDDDKQAFKIVNSWGSDWGVGGSIWISYELFKDTDFLIGDVFAVEDFPTEPVAKSYLVVLSEFDYLTFNYFKKSPLYYSVKSDNFKWDTALIRQNPPLARRRGSNLKSFALIHDLTPYLAQNKDINLSAPLIVSTTLINSPLIQNRIHWMDDFDYSSVLSIKKMKLL
jgi:C1A family cysteine protease